MTSSFSDVERFIQHEMRMSHVYQPVMLLELLRSGGMASVDQVARALLSHDASQVEYYAQITKNMVGKVLTKNRRITERDGKAYRLKGFDSLTPSEVETLISFCNAKIGAYVARRGQDVLSQAFDVRKADGIVWRAKVNYRVNATYSWTEKGNAKFPDDRSCHFTGVGRELIRTITLTSPAGKVTNVGEYKIALPAPSSRSFGGNGSRDNCNSRAGEMGGLLNTAVGNYPAWKTYIDGDNSATKEILELFGTVTQRS